MESPASIRRSQNRSPSLAFHPGTLNFRARLNEAQRINNLNKKMAIRLENVKSVYITEDCRYHSTVKSRQMVVANYVRFPFLISRNFDRSTASYTSSVDVVTSSVSTRDKNAHKSRNILTFQNRIGRENICSKSKRNKVISSQSSRGGNIISNRCYSTGRRKPDIKCRNKSGVVDAAPSSSTFELEEDKSVTDYFNNFDEHTEFALSNEIYDGVSIIGSLLATDMGEEDFDNCRHNEKVLMTMGGKSSKNVLPDDDKSNNTNRNSCEEVYDSDFELDLNDSAVGCDDALLGKRENPSQKKQSAIGNEADTMRSEIALIKRTWRRQLVVDTGCDSPIPTASQKQKTTPHPRTMGQKKKIPDEMVPSVPDSMSMSLGSASTTIEESSIITQSASKSYYRRPQPPPGTTQSRSQNQNRKVRSKFQPVYERLGCNVPVDAYKSSKPQVAMNRLMAAPSQPVRPPVRKPISTPFRARARMIKSANSQYTTDVTRLISDASTPVNGMAIALILTSRETATNTSHISTTACVNNSNLIGEESAPKEKEGNPHNDNSEADGYFSDEEKVGERDIGNQNEADNVFVKAYEDSEGDDYEDDYYDDDDDDDIGPEYLSPSTADGRKGAGIEHGTLSPCVPTSMPVPISVLYDSDAETVRRYHSPIEPTIPISKALSRHNINKKTTGIALTESVQLSFKSLLI